MTKYPIPENEKERLNALRSYAILDSLSEDEFDRITELASLICDVPVSLVSLIDEERQWFKSKIGFEKKETYRNLSFCQHTIMGTEILEVADATKDERFKYNELVTGDPNIRFYAGYPLIDPDGYALGTLCVIDHYPNQLSDVQCRSLKLLAQEVITLIVERRKKEELKHFEQLFKFSNDLICIADASGTFKKINPAFKKILGWENGLLLSSSVFDLVHPDDQERTKEEARQLAAGRPAVNFTHRLKTTDSHYKYIQWTVTPEEATGFLFAIGRDITDFVLQQEELKKAIQLAEEASSCKSEFLANVSHEIRTPLNGVIGFTDLVLKTSLDQTQYQHLSIVNQSANTLLLIINDILDFSKARSGKLELDIEKCDIYEIACRAADIITYPVQDKKIRTLLNISPDLPRFIWADAVRLKQILINLLGNAVKFTEKGEIELKIKMLSADGEEAKLRFEVRDTGIGIPESKQEKIFEAFSQADCSITKRYGGTGLGLTISNKLLGLMGSRLQLKSIPAEGSCFYFDVSFRSENGARVNWEKMGFTNQVVIVDESNPSTVYMDGSLHRAGTVNPEEIDGAGQPLTILIAEDNRVNMLLIKTVLKRITPHATLIEANNGREAVVHCQSKFPDLILMDIQMPDMNGYEATTRIRAIQQENRHIPIIAVTAGSLKSEKNRCLDAGMDDIIVKPFVEETLLAVISKWLHQSG